MSEVAAAVGAAPRITEHRRRFALGVMFLAVTPAGVGLAVTEAPGQATTVCRPSAERGRSTWEWTGPDRRTPGSWGPQLSADGRYVAFSSYDDSLVVSDTNEYADVFRVDRSTGAVQRVSVDADGAEFRQHAAEVSISADGTRAAFSTDFEVHVRDIPTSRTIAAGVSSSGIAADGWSGAPVLSPDGRFVAFTSRATNLVTSDRSYESIEAYLRDLATGTTERVSIGAGGLFAPTWSWAEAVSRGGRYVAFTAGAAGGSLTPNDTYPGADVFLRDRQAKTTEVVSVSPDGRSMGGWFLGMSADGMRILFGSGPQADSKPAAFLRDWSTRTTRLVAPLATTWGRPAGTRPTPLAFFGQRRGMAALSADGQIAALQTAMSTGPDDTNVADDIVLIDLATGARHPATRSVSGCAGNGPSGEPGLSHTGSVVAFTSEADDLTDDDNNRITNVYVRETAGQRTEQVSTTPRR